MGTALLDFFGVILLGAVGVLAVAVVSGSGVPAPLGQVVDALGLGGLSLVQLTAVAGVGAAAALLGKAVVSLLLLRRILHYLAHKAAQVSARSFASFFAGSVLDVERNASQKTAYDLTNGTNYAVVGVLGSVAVGLSETAVIIVLAVTLIIVNPVVAIVAMLYLALVAVLLQRALGPWTSRASARVVKADIASTTLIQEGVATYREVAVLDRREFFYHRIRGLRADASRGLADQQFIALLPRYLLEVALGAGIAILAVSQLMTQNSEAAVGTLAIFLGAGTRLLPSIFVIQAAVTRIRTHATAAKGAYRLGRDSRDAPLLPVQDAAEVRQRIAKENADFLPTIQVKSVTFSYPSSRHAALTDVTLAISSGSSVALVGPTGAGKSTLADVILGVVDPAQGSVLVGGCPPKEAVVKWAGAIAYVPQQVSLVQGTVRENVAIGLPVEATEDARVWEALERARLDSFLASRDGLDTLVGERGVRLSGGQRQRLGIARALYTRPRLLVLDEATSALDAETEQLISAMLREMEGHVTTVTVAHRLATIRFATVIAYLDGGRVIATGTFDELRDTTPAFRRQAKLLGL